MNKIEFLSASLPYGLKLMDKFGICDMIGLEINECLFHASQSEYDWYSIYIFTPIVRPISDLTKECIQADYNDGKPFVPIYHIDRLFGKHININCDLSGNIYIRGKYDSGITVNDIMPIFKQLLKWHFWPDMPEGENVVYVSETFNPYK